MQHATPSEILIFQKLANPARVSRVPKDPVKKAEEVFKHAVRDEVHMRRSFKATTEESDNGERRREDEQPREEHHSKRRDDEDSLGRRDEDKRHADDEQPSCGGGGNAKRELSEDEAAAEQDREKLGMIDFINKKAMRGVRTTKAYEKSDPFDEIQFEYERIKTNEETNGAVNLMREGLRFMCQGVEMGNDKFGPILSLNRWVETKLAPETMSRFDPVLEKLYKKHWRKGSMAPELELIMLVGGSMAMHHFETVRGGGAAANTAPPFARQHSAGPTAPFNLIGALMGGGGQPQAAAPPPALVTPPQSGTSQTIAASSRQVMKGPVDHSRQQPAQFEELMHAQDTQMRALQQRAMMLAARQRELDLTENRMDRRVPAAAAVFVSMQRPQIAAAERRVVEVLVSDYDARSIALSDSGAQAPQSADEEESTAATASEVDSQASSSYRQRKLKSYTKKSSKNKLRV